MDFHPTPHAKEVLPSEAELQHARSQLIECLPSRGLGLDVVRQHLENDLVPALNKPSKSSTYYGFVTGGATPAAAAADHIAIENDQNVCVHLPKETIATEVEDRALSMICEFLRLTPEDWPHRTFTTGATASNVVGLACGREFVLREAAIFNGEEISVADLGVHAAMRKAGIESIQILTTAPHSSLRKAASIVGLGRACVKDVGLSESPHRFDLKALRAELTKPKVASIVAISCAEVNTGFFATTADEMQQIRQLCDQYGAWLHVDAAFGLLARTLPDTAEYEAIVNGVRGLELADSITGDAHKLLNVPYDCGIFLSRHLAIGTAVFLNTNAAYLTPAGAASDGEERIIPSPLNIGIENSRRFRALPVYATLGAYGRDGYRDMLERQIRLSRRIAAFISASQDYVLLPEGNREEYIYIIVLFRARDDKINAELVQRINATRKIYVSGTQWSGSPAARFAVANWMVDVDADLKVIKEVLQAAVR